MKPRGEFAFKLLCPLERQTRLPASPPPFSKAFLRQMHVLVPIPMSSITRNWLPHKTVMRVVKRNLLIHSKLFSASEDSSSKGASSGSQSVRIELPISTITLKDGFQTRESVKNFLAHLNDEQKDLLYHSLNVHVHRDQLESHWGSSKSESYHYLSKFGRPTAAVDDSAGASSEVTADMLQARIEEKIVPASASALWAVGLKNALPFVGFGFLDNLIMILAGDYIDITIGTTLGISTMAAAALGNTISDVAGIGSAWYVEELANKVGIKDPKLTPSQIISWPVRWASNGGRAIGVVIGCLLGMVPLFFLPSPEEKEERERQSVGKAASGTV